MVWKGFRVMWRSVLLLTGAACLASCNGAADDGPEEAETPAPASTAIPAPEESEGPPPLAERSSSGARDVKEETDDFVFEYAYPAQVGLIDGLATLLDGRLEERREDLARTSAEAREQARSDGFPYNKHSYTADWKVVADLPRWLSLSNEFTTYSGGAHGMYGLESLVWDKEEEQAMQGIDLFTSPAALEEALGTRFCEDLDRQRVEKRGEEMSQEMAEGTSFTDCPGIDELTVLVGSRSGRRFDRLTLYAGPYVAGPYAEGAYKVDLRVDDAVLEAVKPEFRESFASRN
jgi:hypothetical protein